LKEAPYIEASRAYGAGDRRIIFRYLIPRIGAVMIPQLVILIPSYVFLEATLAVLQVSDPILPTWGKLIVDALQYGTHSGDIHMLLIPAALLMITGVAFAMVGLALERVLDPRLRER
jgi:peptide/nickel transport system permease protein